MTHGCAAVRRTLLATLLLVGTGKWTVQAQTVQPPTTDVSCLRDVMIVTLDSATLTHANGTTGGDQCLAHFSAGAAQFTFSVLDGAAGCSAICQQEASSRVCTAYIDADDRTTPTADTFIVTERYENMNLTCRYPDYYTGVVDLGSTPLLVDTVPTATHPVTPNNKPPQNARIQYIKNAQPILEITTPDSMILRTSIDRAETKWTSVKLDNCWLNFTGFPDKYQFIENGCPVNFEDQVQEPHRLDLTPHQVDIDFTVFKVSPGDTAMYVTCDITVCEALVDCPLASCPPGGGGGGRVPDNTRVEDMVRVRVTSSRPLIITGNPQGTTQPAVETTRPPPPPPGEVHTSVLDQGSHHPLTEVNVGDVVRFHIPDMLAPGAAWQAERLDWCQISNNDQFEGDQELLQGHITQYIWAHRCSGIPASEVTRGVMLTDDPAERLTGDRMLMMRAVKYSGYDRIHIRCRVTLCLTESECQECAEGGEVVDSRGDVQQRRDWAAHVYVMSNVTVAVPDDTDLLLAHHMDTCHEEEHMCLHAHYVYIICAVMSVVLLVLCGVIAVLVCDRRRRYRRGRRAPGKSQALMTPSSPTSSSSTTPQSSVRIPRVSSQHQQRHQQWNSDNMFDEY